MKGTNTMKISVIKLDEHNTNLGYLLYFENDKSFVIELPEDANEWRTPLLLSSYVKRKKYTVYPADALMWVKVIIVPNSRHNIGSILKDNGLSEYDEYKLLIMDDGRRSQDNYYLETVNSQPPFIKERHKFLIKDFLILSNKDIAVFFRNDETRIFGYRADCESIAVSAGGYGLLLDGNSFVNNRTIYNHALYRKE